ncbi:MAG: hypothetical protein VZR11_10545, partial [Succinimonas sp.]|nr:hypothetical protein [Succinimonas sp.]
VVRISNTLLPAGQDLIDTLGIISTDKSDCSGLCHLCCYITLQEGSLSSVQMEFLNIRMCSILFISLLSLQNTELDIGELIRDNACRIPHVRVSSDDDVETVLCAGEYFRLIGVSADCLDGLDFDTFILCLID